jgi:hypothetical protein
MLKRTGCTGIRIAEPGTCGAANCGFAARVGQAKTGCLSIGELARESVALKGAAD